jgi:predicted PurR-regulated permease PerM
MGIIHFLGMISDVLIPFMVALILAYIIHPMVIRVENFAKPVYPHFLEKMIPLRVFAVILSIMFILFFGAFLLYITIPIITTEIQHTNSVISKMIGNAEWKNRAMEKLPKDYWKYVEEVFQRKDVQEFLHTRDFLTIVNSTARKLLPGIWGVLSTTTSFLFSLLGFSVIALYLGFLLIYYEIFVEGCRELLPQDVRKPIIKFIKDFDRVMNQYFRAQAFVAFLVGIMFTIGFWIIDMPLFIIVGMFIGLLNMVPYLQLIGFIPALVLGTIAALETGTSIGWTIFLILLVFGIIQAIQDGILVPRIMGDATGLNPVVILLSLSIWGKLLGFLGLLIAIPITGLISAYYQSYLLEIKSSPLITTKL